jgi:hypothetical protein
MQLCPCQEKIQTGVQFTQKEAFDGESNPAVHIDWSNQKGVQWAICFRRIARPILRARIQR